jgi:hypothetical protein
MRPRGAPRGNHRCVVVVEALQPVAAPRTVRPPSSDWASFASSGPRVPALDQAIDEPGCVRVVEHVRPEHLAHAAHVDAAAAGDDQRRLVLGEPAAVQP